ncbi:MAG: hypothetical protein Q9222_006785 [Ikaeria aurantiellina]
MLLTLSLLTSFLLPLIQAQQPAASDSCSLAQFDRCGPANQAPGTPSTCNATIETGIQPSAYTVQCSQNLELRTQLNFPNCAISAADICNKLTDPHVKKDRWIWTNPAYIGCAFGFWLPSGNGSDAAFAPNYDRCMVGIFTPLARLCTNPSWNNVGSVNVKVMPNTTQTGVAADPYYPSYVIAPAQLTQYAYGQ